MGLIDKLKEVAKKASGETSQVTNYDNILADVKKSLASAEAGEISSINNNFALNNRVIDDNYNAEIANTERAYNALYDQNAVDRIVGERKIAESMANMGSTDSGLNRTQQTANQLAYGNRNNQIGLSKQQAIDTIALTMRNQKANLEMQKNADIQSVRSGYAQQAVKNATDIYNQQVQAEADVNKAIIDAQEKAANAKTSAYNNLITNLTKENVSDETKAALAEQYINTYKISVEEKQGIAKMLPSGVRNSIVLSSGETVKPAMSTAQFQDIKDDLKRKAIDFYYTGFIRNTSDLYNFLSHYQWQYDLSDDQLYEIIYNIETTLLYEENGERLFKKYDKLEVN